MTDIGTPIATRAPAFGAIELDCFTPSDDQAIRLVVGKTADTVSDNNNGGPNESAHPAEVTNWRRRHTHDDLEDMHHDMGAVARPAYVSEEPGRSHASDTPHAVNDDFRRIQVLGSINE